MRPILTRLTILALLASSVQADPEAVTVHREACRVLFEVYRDAKWNPSTWTYGKAGYGSGIGYREDGWVLTTAHQVRKAKSLTLVGPDGIGRKADRWRWSEVMDVGVVHVPGFEVPVPRWGDSVALRVGETTYLVGQPLGYSASLSRGILSGKYRNLRLGGKFTKPFQGYLQTEALAYSGNSGGPLLNGKGEVVGLLCESLSLAQKKPTDISFAIPSEFFRRLADRLIAEKPGIRHGAIEAMPANCAHMPLEVRKRIGCWRREGAVLHDLKPGARASGLEEGDVVISVDGAKVVTWMHLEVLVGLRRPGDEVTLEIQRKGEVRNVRVKLSEYRVE